MDETRGALALYTTIYPGVERYLRDWYRSVLAQTDQTYQLWIGLDALDIRSVVNAMGGEPKATWVMAEPGETPAQIRQRAFEQITAVYDGVVLVDSDDILHSTRVAAARAALAQSDLNACALRLVDQQGHYLGLDFELPLGQEAEFVLPRNNIFGLSNTAFRSDLLRRCLPIPAEIELVDWFLATRAWLCGACLSFDRTARMDYRQHGRNMVQVRYPLGTQQIVQDTARARVHFQHLRALGRSENHKMRRWAELEETAAEVDRFYQRVVLEPTRLQSYVQTLNALKPAAVWWSSVAHPALRDLWVF